MRKSKDLKYVGHNNKFNSNKNGDESPHFRFNKQRSLRRDKKSNESNGMKTKTNKTIIKLMKAEENESHKDAVGNSANKEYVSLLYKIIGI